ncbi:MAG: Tm-1-like ATP-binding domain-containing protein [Anaerolineae bacterium]|nr:Tm-1-like ATP-binding domain-containing protein [Anaerolineae bacterium]
MTKTVVIVGSLDTKGDDFAFVKELIENQGLRALVVDFGVLGEPGFQPDISREEVARAGGGELAVLRSGERKDEAMRIMASGVAAIVRRLYEEGRLDGILGMGGGGGTSIATAAMRTLPVGVPKLMVSTLAGGDVSEYAGTRDITFMPSVVDVAGVNRISRAIYANAAGAIAGMVKMERPTTAEDRPLITASMFGNTTPCVNRARGILEDHGYEVLVFHATGTGGRTMESLIADGYIVGSLDITTTELADYVCGGVLSAGPERCLAAARAGIPAVLVPGCVDMANFWALDSVPEKYRQRNLYQWNPNITLLRTNVEENIRIGEMLAAAANAATGPVAILLPLRGVSMLDSEGGAFWDPEADHACYQAIKRHLRPGIPVIEMDHNINDPEFADKAAEVLLQMLRGAQE